ncbi:MAG: MarR family transcriptional regulator [Streptosporangiales bacterium]|nr:MarR family transcriptional regulator [Streptosporangiales bacterium]
MGKGAAPWDLPLALLGATRAHLGEAHRLLAERGHPDTRPVHGFALQAVGDGATATEVASRLGVTKQAAAKTIELLEQQGYVARSVDAGDRRRKLVVPTDRGRDFLAASVAVFAEIREKWSATLGVRRLSQLERDLATVAGSTSLRLDLPGWLSGSAG